MRQLSVVTFGGLRLYSGDDREIRFSTRKTAALVAYLAMHPKRRWEREALCGLFWGDKSEDQARHSLSQALSEIRRTLGKDLVLTDGQRIWISSDEVCVDALELAELTRERNLTSLDRAEAIYRGDFLAYGELDEEPFDKWLLEERERLRTMAQRGLATALSLHARNTDEERRLRTARAMLNLDPFDEPAHCLLMQAYAAQGRTALAIDHYRRLARDLRREFGVGPEEETVATLKRIVERAKAPSRSPSNLSQFAFVLEQLPHPVVITDTRNRIVGWNNLAEKIFGFTKKEILGRSPTMMYAPDRDQSLADSIFKHAVQSGRWSERVSLVGKDGRCCHQQRLVAPLYAPDGELIGAFGYGLTLS